MGNKGGESEVLDWLGEVYVGLGRYETIGAPEAGEIRTRLATTGDYLTE
jgi:hypothetical protein